MSKQVWLTRDEAELLVDLLEDNYRNAKISPYGVGADLAVEIREIFGMVKQPNMKCKENHESMERKG